MIDLQKIDEDIIAQKVASLPVPPVIAKELSVLIPTIVKEHTVQFAVGLAHEVRNPLTNIGLAVEMLRSTELTDIQKLYIDIIMRGSGRINDLVTDLLTSYHADTKLQEKENIHELLDEVLLMATDRIMLKEIKVDKYYTAPDHNILMNRQKLKIAISNIIINAIEAMPKEGGALLILTKSVNEKCVVEISDNGIGMSKENLEQIFKPYFTNKEGGLGLGLSTTLDILLLNHAKLVVKSELGKGSAFIITFGKSVEIIPPGE